MVSPKCRQYLISIDPDIVPLLEEVEHKSGVAVTKVISGLARMALGLSYCPGGVVDTVADWEAIRELAGTLKLTARANSTNLKEEADLVHRVQSREKGDWKVGVEFVGYLERTGKTFAEIQRQYDLKLGRSTLTMWRKLAKKESEVEEAYTQGITRLKDICTLLGIRYHSGS
jgi:hypothetical protein